MLHRVLYLNVVEFVPSNSQKLSCASSCFFHVSKASRLLSLKKDTKNILSLKKDTMNIYTVTKKGHDEYILSLKKDTKIYCH